MATAVVMPKLGWTMEVGSVVEWLKKDGDTVTAGEVIFNVEADKGLSEVEALANGVLRIPPDSPLGKEVPVGTVLAWLIQPNEVVSFEAAHADQAAAMFAQASVVVSAASAVVATEHQNGVKASPRARRVARELGVDWASLKGSGQTGRIVERDIRQVALKSTAAVRASPLARRLAAEAAIDLAKLAASLPGKRITREDVEAAIREQEAPVRNATAPQPVEQAAYRHAAEMSAAVTTERVVREPLPTVRRIVRDRMAAAAHTTAPVTLMSEADATEFVALRQRLVAVAQVDGKPQAPTYNDLLVKLVACALIQHPDLNSSLGEADTLIRHLDVHVGLAVDTERGLLVPVIRDAHKKGLWAIAAESARLVERARSGALSPDDLRGGTFTITNLGALEVDVFTPIINLPECAVLGVGKIALRPVVDASGERLIPRQTVTLSLTADHRVVDGAPAARFLRTIKRFVEEPLLWLAS